MVQVQIYDSYFKDLGDGVFTMGTDTFKIMLVTSSYTYDATHNRRDDITNEVTGTGYTAGGETLGTVTYTNDASNNRSLWDFADPTWASSTITARGAVIYKSNGGASSADELVLFIDFEVDESSSNTEFKIQLNSNGMFAVRAG